MNWLLNDWVHKGEISKKIVEDSADDMLVAAQCYKSKPGMSVTVLDDGELQSIKVPALFLIGENERIYFPQKAVERLNRIAPQIKTEIIPGAGHDLNFVQAGMVNKKILEFLKSN